MTKTINNDAIFLNINLDTNNKDEAISKISQKIHQLSGLESEDLQKGFNAREILSTTGFGAGFAIPHTKMPIQKGLIAFFRFNQPIEWKSLDDQPVTTAIALVMPESDTDNLHLKMISKLARLLMHEEFTDTLAKLNKNEDIANYLNSKLED